MRLLLFFIISALVSGSSSCFNSRPSKKVQIASEIRSNTVNKLKVEMDLIPFGFGGQMMGQIEMLSLVFQYRQPVDLPEARRMLIRATNLFLNEINSNEKIRPYLNNYPFETRSISILILLQKPDGSNVDQGELTLIESSDGFLEYEIHDPQTQLLSTILKETFEEANQNILQ